MMFWLTLPNFPQSEFSVFFRFFIAWPAEFLRETPFTPQINVYMTHLHVDTNIYEHCSYSRQQSVTSMSWIRKPLKSSFDSNIFKIVIIFTNQSNRRQHWKIENYTSMDFTNTYNIKPPRTFENFEKQSPLSVPFHVFHHVCFTTPGHYKPVVLQTISYLQCLQVVMSSHLSYFPAVPSRSSWKLEARTPPLYPVDPVDLLVDPVDLLVDPVDLLVVDPVDLLFPRCFEAMRRALDHFDQNSASYFALQRWPLGGPTRAGGRRWMPMNEARDRSQFLCLAVFFVWRV